MWPRVEGQGRVFSLYYTVDFLCAPDILNLLDGKDCIGYDVRHETKMPDSISLWTLTEACFQDACSLFCHSILPRLRDIHSLYDAYQYVFHRENMNGLLHKTGEAMIDLLLYMNRCEETPAILAEMKKWESYYAGFLDTYCEKAQADMRWWNNQTATVQKMLNHYPKQYQHAMESEQKNRDGLNTLKEKTRQLEKALQDENERARRARRIAEKMAENKNIILSRFSKKERENLSAFENGWEKR